ncbi:MAG: LptF/LptG family permease [Phycisphaerae bacterium]
MPYHSGVQPAPGPPAWADQALPRRGVGRPIGPDRAGGLHEKNFMLWTLQWYIFREVGKTFLLTAVGITAVLSMGGGVLNMIELDSIGAGQLVRLMSLVFPVAMTLALPIAALFAAAVTYGRLSADNEFVACRASGVNIHILFAPPLLVSLVSSLVTFFSVNYMIPGQVRNIDRLVRSDVGGIVVRKLQDPSRLPMRKDRIRIYAADPRVVEVPDLPPDSQYVLAQGVAYAEMDDNGWARCGTAESVLIRFDNLETDPTAAAEFRNVVYYDYKDHRWSSHSREGIVPTPIPRQFRLRVKWLNLSELYDYRHRVSDLPEMRKHMARLRGMLIRERFYQQLARDFAKPGPGGGPNGTFALSDSKATYTVEADALTPDLHDGKPTLQNVKVTERVDDTVRHIVAGAGTVTVEADPPSARLELFDGVTLTPADYPDDAVTKSRERLRAVALPAGLLEEVRALSNEQLLDPGEPISAGEGFQTRREAVMAKRDATAREIAGVIHARLAISASAFVLVILGAVLGIVFRGAHVLTAFGISFVPSLFVMVCIIMGRQLSQNPDTTFIGILTTWAGIMLVGGLDVWTLARVLRR